MLINNFLLSKDLFNLVPVPVISFRFALTILVWPRLEIYIVLLQNEAQMGISISMHMKLSKIKVWCLNFTLKIRYCLISVGIGWNWSALGVAWPKLLSCDILQYAICSVAHSKTLIVKQCSLYIVEQLCVVNMNLITGFCWPQNISNFWGWIMYYVCDKWTIYLKNGVE